MHQGGGGVVYDHIPSFKIFLVCLLGMRGFGILNSIIFEFSYYCVSCSLSVFIFF